MNRLFAIIALAIVVCVFAQTSSAQKHKKASGKAIVFKSEDFDTQEKISKQSEDLIDVSGGKYLKKYNVKKIGIVEFYVEFLQNREIQQSVYESQNAYSAASSGSGFFGPRTFRTESIKFRGDYYRDAVLMLYDVVTGDLEKSSFQFLPRQTMGTDPGFKGL